MVLTDQFDQYNVRWACWLQSKVWTESGEVPVSQIISIRLKLAAVLRG